MRHYYGGVVVIQVLSIRYLGTIKVVRFFNGALQFEVDSI